MNTTWVPQDCTLPSAEHPVRVRQFDDLVADTALEITRVDARHVRLELEPTPEVASRAAELAVRETSCCGFFTFTLTAGDRRLLLEVTVPEGRVDVMDALVSRVGS